MSDRISVDGDHLEKVYDSFFRGLTLFTNAALVVTAKCVKGRFEIAQKTAFWGVPTSFCKQNIAFWKVGYAPRVVFTSPNKSHHSYKT